MFVLLCLCLSYQSYYLPWILNCSLLTNVVFVGFFFFFFSEIADEDFIAADTIKSLEDIHLRATKHHGVYQVMTLSYLNNLMLNERQINVRTSVKYKRME